MLPLAVVAALSCPAHHHVAPAYWKVPTTFIQRWYDGFPKHPRFFKSARN
jgi:hypothetical protein